jgi:hypothetical protein
MTCVVRVRLFFTFLTIDDRSSMSVSQVQEGTFSDYREIERMKAIVGLEHDVTDNKT